MANFGQEYAWGSGHNLSLGSLINIANQLHPQNYRMVGGARYSVGIRSQPVDVFPVRTMLAAGYERGDGRIDHVIDMTLTKFAVKFVLDTYLSSGTLVKAPMTIYVRRHELDTMRRYNAYLILPKPTDTLEYLRQGVFRVSWRFTKLVAL